MEHEIIDIAPEPSPPTQQHNFNGEGLPENELTKFVTITTLLEMAASRMGVLVCGWAAVVLVQGGMVFTLQTKDRVFVTVIFLLVCIRNWRFFCPQATGSLTDGSRSLSGNDVQQLALSTGSVSRLLYWCKLVSAIICAVLSMMRLALHDFGQTEVPNMATRDFALNVFYGVELVEAIVLVLDLVFVQILAISRALTEALIELAKKVKSNNCIGSLIAAHSNRGRCCKGRQKLQILSLEAESWLYSGLKLLSIRRCFILSSMLSF